MSATAADAKHLIKRLDPPRLRNYWLEIGLTAAILILGTSFVRNWGRVIRTAPVAAEAHSGEVELPLRLAVGVVPIAAGRRVTLVVVRKDKTVTAPARIARGDSVFILSRSDALRVMNSLPGEIYVLVERP